MTSHIQDLQLPQVFISLITCFQSPNFAFLVTLGINFLGLLSPKGKYIWEILRGLLWAQERWIKCLKTVHRVFQSCCISRIALSVRSWNLSCKCFHVTRSDFASSSEDWLTVWLLEDLLPDLLYDLGKKRCPAQKKTWRQILLICSPYSSIDDKPSGSWCYIWSFLSNIPFYHLSMQCKKKPDNIVLHIFLCSKFRHSSICIACTALLLFLYVNTFERTII